MHILSECLIAWDIPAMEKLISSKDELLSNLISKVLPSLIDGK
jgi:hypothetical protein